MDTNVRKFLKQLLKDAGQTGLPAAVEEQLLEDLNVRLEQKLILASMDSLPAKKQAELEKMAEKPEKPEKLMEFLRSNIKDIDKVFVKALQEFRDLYLEK